jgi:hypothetical protein
MENPVQTNCGACEVCKLKLVVDRIVHRLSALQYVENKRQAQLYTAKLTGNTEAIFGIQADLINIRAQIMACENLLDTVISIGNFLFG